MIYAISNILMKKSSQYSQVNNSYPQPPFLNINLLKEIRLKSAPGTHLNERRRAGLTRLAVAPCFVASSRRKICLAK